MPKKKIAATGIVPEVNKCDSNSCSVAATKVLFFTETAPLNGDYAANIKPVWLCEAHYQSRLRTLKSLAARNKPYSYHYQILLQLNEEHHI